LTQDYLSILAEFGKINLCFRPPLDLVTELRRPLEVLGCQLLTDIGGGSLGGPFWEAKAGFENQTLEL